jgi:mannose-6-phosphate isomerase-like protein (cupin superfamily)
MSKDNIQPISSFLPRSQHDLFSGKGEVKIWNLLRRPDQEPFKAILWCELEGNGSVGTHYQKEYPEIIVCLQGHGSAVIGHETFALAPGICVHLAQGQTLALKNEANHPLTYLIIKADQPST